MVTCTISVYGAYRAKNLATGKHDGFLREKPHASLKWLSKTFCSLGGTFKPVLVLVAAHTKACLFSTRLHVANSRCPFGG